MTSDHELKIGRAQKHLEGLSGEIAGWLNGYACSVRQEYDPDAQAWPEAQGRIYMLGGTVVVEGLTAPEGNLNWGHGLIAVFLDEVPAKEVPDSFGLLIGDFLHNLRSALDNLAYALMLAGPGPVTDKMRSNSEFPIFAADDGGRPGQGPVLVSKAARKYTGWRREVKAAAEAVRPYRRGQDYSAHPLRWLHELNRV